MLNIKNTRLNNITQYFLDQLNLTPCVGIEIEFYIHGNVNIKLLEKSINHKILKERGKNQYEISLDPSLNMVEYAEKVWKLRKNIMSKSKNLGCIADFRSKPFPDDYGNSMHVHLNFLENNDIEQYAKILCHYILQEIDYFLPSKNDYHRLDKRFMAPTHICYGGNNRTTMIRIPDSKPLRIEHRLAAAMANPFDIIYSILNSISLGINNPHLITDIPKIFGNGFDKQYKLIAINQNLG